MYNSFAARHPFGFIGHLPSLLQAVFLTMIIPQIDL